jgi:hypothetical protein
MHGMGRMIYQDGDWYLGEFSHNQIEGRGVYRHLDGTTYEGEWKRDK